MLQNIADTFTYTTTTTTSSSSGIGALLMIYLIIFILSIPLIYIPLWKMYAKAGRPGWAAIIPVYSTWVLFEITGFPAWWSLLSLIPFVSLFPAVVAIMAIIRLVKLFGKGTGFGVAAVFFPFICYPILGYGSAQFQGAAPAPEVGPVPSGPQVPAPPAV